MIIRKDSCIVHGLTDVYLIKGKGNFACIKCLKMLSSPKISVQRSSIHIIKPTYIETEELVTCKA